MSRRINNIQSQVAHGSGLSIQSGGFVSGYVHNGPTSAAVPGILPIGLQQQIQTHNLGLADAFDPKRAGKNPKLSHIIFVLDDSYSMQSCRQQTISGFNEYLGAQKIDAQKSGIETLVSLYKFDGNNVKRVFDRTPVESVKPLDTETYNPTGSTNLLDAIGGVMMEINNGLTAKKKDERESVIITILTDGEENASKTFRSSTDIKKMVSKAEEKNWGFMFLGANVDAFLTGGALGFNAHNTMQFATANATETIRAASEMTSRMKASYSKGMDTVSLYATTAFTDAERSASIGKKDE